MELNDAFVNTYIKKMKETVDDLQGRLIIAETKNEILDETVKERDKQIEDVVTQFRAQETELHVANEKAVMADKYGDVLRRLDEMTVKYEGTLADYDKIKGDGNNYNHILNQKLDEIAKLKRVIARCPKCFEDHFGITPEEKNVGHIVTTPGVALVPTVTTLSSNNSDVSGSYWNETVILEEPYGEVVGMESAMITKPKARPARTNTKK
jgi:hypothetical protein